ncbi:hypothetical protein DK389_01975 [Methylobacterium durans]|uniref:DUF2188 domain-containing protein n=1 Tax=Methylobacterium durans TaxID=2202825 RepID=A0A2U8W2M1_9HYPH|nr:hypothetical protein DK389_01975 [Methylobacterium durans]
MSSDQASTGDPAASEPHRYSLRRQDGAWTVYCARTGQPVRLNEVPQVGLTRAVAADVARALNSLDPCD